MAKLKLTAEQQVELQRRGSLLELDLSGAQRFMPYHDPRTGQEFPRLPADEYSLTNYMMRGLRPGRAPEDLRRTWEVNRPAREAKAQQRNEALRRSPHGREVEDQFSAARDGDEIQERINRAVREALAAAGVIPASQTSAATPPVQEQVPQGPTQLKLL